MKDWKFHCAVLGVREDASAKEVRRAYRRLALERHPDKHNNSTQAKEEFQRLNESYSYLIDGLAEGRRAPPPQPAPPRAAPERPAPRASEFVPAPRRSSPPAPIEPQLNYRKLGLHAAIACAAITVLSLVFDLHGGNRRIERPGQRDLSIHSWCLIKAPGAPVPEQRDVYEYWSEQACQEHCGALAKTADSSCSWNGVEFRSTRAPSPAARTASSDDAEPKEQIAPCGISLERSAGDVVSSGRVVPEQACLSLCRERADTFPRAGVRCSWAGSQIFQQALYVPPPDSATEPVPTPLPPSLDSLAGNDFTSSCYMSVVMEGKVSAEAYPNETKDSCIERCSREIVAHPLDREVACSFAGRQVSKHVPDRLDSYLASRDPAEAAEVQAGSSLVGLCEIYGSAGGSRLMAFTATSTRTECENRCHYEFDHGMRAVDVTCSYAKKEFFHKPSK